MKLYPDTPVYPQSIDHDVNGTLRCSDEIGYGPRSGIDVLTLAALEFAKVHLAELIDHKHGCTEPMRNIEVEAAVRGWETAELWVAASARQQGNRPAGNPG